MLDFTLPHRRYNPLTDEWVLVSPHRSKRPWKGSVESPQETIMPEHDKQCYLCPGNTRSNGETNPMYTKTFVFTNDHAALIPSVHHGQFELGQQVMHAEQESGVCKVLCYSPSHRVGLSQMSAAHVRNIVDTWSIEYKTIGADKNISYVQIFENKGPLMGASSPHPHGQIWATNHIPTIVSKETTMQEHYFAKHNKQLLLSYLEEERSLERIIHTNTSFTTLVPFWAVWPYETMIVPNRHIRSLGDMTSEEKTHLAESLHVITHAYDKVFEAPFPYSMGIHQEPTTNKSYEAWQFHMHFYPPLLRSATIKKYYVGYEMMAEAQRDITPEVAAKKLQSLV